MSAYVFSINDYHSIKTASINLDGITVLAGINGCGKSTISRWIYYLVNGMRDFGNKQKEKLIYALINVVNQLALIYSTSHNYAVYRHYINEFQKFFSKDGLDESALKEVFEAFTIQAKTDLQASFTTANPSEIKRLSNYLFNKDTLIENSITAIERFIQNRNDFYATQIELFHDALASCYISDLEKAIQSEYEEDLMMPKKFSFEEYGTPLITDKHFSVPLMLSRAIYIDTPMALSDQANPFEENIWGHFRQLLNETNGKKCESTDQLQSLIHNAIGGTVKLVKDDIGYSQELHYIRQDGLNIKLEDAATGIKTFAYLLRLLENGWLNEEAILLIDEPEAHLHPQWIVEFARIIVLLSKKLGVKIVLASHNPDMIAAIQSIADREQMLHKTHFYLAETDINGFQYNFVDKGSEIGDIFESFNIAISRIEQYGTPII